MLIFLFNTIFFVAAVTMVVYLIIKKKRFLASYRFLFSAAILFVTIIMYVGIFVAAIKSNGNHDADIEAWNTKRSEALTEVANAMADADDDKKEYDAEEAEKKASDATYKVTEYSYKIDTVRAAALNYNSELEKEQALHSNVWTNWYHAAYIMDITEISEEEITSCYSSDYLAWQAKQDAKADSTTTK